MRRLAYVVVSLVSFMLIACHHDGGSSDDSPPPATTPPPSGNTAPVASFTSAATAPLNTPVVFDASASSASGGGTLQYVWDFGGGHRGGGKIIARQFTTAGTQSVTLTVIDSAGLSTSQTKAVQVTAPSTAPATVSAQGVVKAADGSALQGVTVTPVGTSAAATTDALGKATLAVNAGVPLTLKLSKAGYADQFVSVQVPATVGSDAYFEATMRTRDAALTLASAATGGTLNGRDGASIIFPANSLVDASGAPVTGAVSLTMTPVDPTGTGGGGFPGQFAGIEPDGSTTPIVSFGTTEFTVTAGGQPLQLAPGKTATIDVPLYATLNIDGSPLTAGSTVPLWSLDEVSSIWVREGDGTVVESASSPTGLAMRATVTHLSWWNADLGFEPYGPKPKCVYDTDIGIPEARDTFATATVCNMLAEIDRTLGGNGNSAAPSNAGVTIRAAAPSTNPRVAGYSRQAILPIAGDTVIPVPANVNVLLTATALNGTWRGTKVVNGPFDVTAVEEIKMRPLAPSGPGTETVTLPFDETRAMQSITDVDTFNFVGSAYKYARIILTSGTGSSLRGSLRVLQGNTVLATANFTNSPQPTVVVLPADATYTVQVAASSNAPGTYRLQIETLGAVQSDTLTLPFETSKAISAFSTYRASFTINAPTAVSFAYRAASSDNASVRVVGPGGQVMTSEIIGGALVSKAVALPAAGTYFLEIAPNRGSAGTYELAADPTAWVSVAPPITPVSRTLSMIGLVADRNGKAVVGYSRTYVNPTPTNHNSAAYSLRRWTGTAWETVGSELVDDYSCTDGTQSASLAFDSANNPVIAHGIRTGLSASMVQVSKFVGGVWQPIGPNNGVLPHASGSSLRTCDDIPVIQLDSNDNPVVAYRAEGDVHVQKFDGANWVDVVSGAATFSNNSLDFDLRIDSSDRIWFVLSAYNAPGQTVVRRLPTLSAPAWETIGPNGGVLPETNTIGLYRPTLRFDGAGNPLIGLMANVNFGGSSNTGTAIYRYNGSAWVSSGGYHPTSSNNSHVSNPMYGGFAVFENAGVMAWLESNNDIGNAPLVQTSSGAGWTAVGAGTGTIPQFTPHGTVNEAQGWQMSLEPIGSELYMAITAYERRNTGNVPLSILLLRKTAN